MPPFLVAAQKGNWPQPSWHTTIRIQPFFGRHAVGIVVGGVGHRSLVVSLCHLKLVQKEPLAQFLNAEGGGKVGPREWEKTQVLECDMPSQLKNSAVQLGP